MSANTRLVLLFSTCMLLLTCTSSMRQPTVIAAISIKLPPARVTGALAALLLTQSDYCTVTGDKQRSSTSSGCSQAPASKCVRPLCHVMCLQGRDQNVKVGM
jgi:hypothetical protein